MNSTVLGFIVAAVVVAGVGGYFLLQGAPKSEDGTQTKSEDRAQAMSGTFASLLAGKQSLECTFEHNDGTNVSSGTVYLASGGEQIRGDFNIQQSGAGAQEAHMIRNGGYNYLWGSFFSQGIKTKVTVENNGKLFDSESGAVDDNTDFECKPWSVDQSKFSLPGAVTFMDVAAQMEDVQATGQVTIPSKAAQCAGCNQVPEGTARQQCLQVLNCN